MATVEVQSPTDVLMENRPRDEQNKVQETPKDEIKRDDDKVYQQEEQEETDDDHEDMIALEVRSEKNTPSRAEKPNGSDNAPKNEDEVKDNEEEGDKETEKEEDIDDDGEGITLEVGRKLEIVEKKQEITEIEEEEEEKEKELGLETKKEASVAPIEDSDEIVEASEEEGIEENEEEKEEAVKNEKTE